MGHPVVGTAWGWGPGFWSAGSRRSRCCSVFRSAGKESGRGFSRPQPRPQPGTVRPMSAPAHHPGTPTRWARPRPSALLPGHPSAPYPDPAPQVLSGPGSPGGAASSRRAAGPAQAQQCRGTSLAQGRPEHPHLVVLEGPRLLCHPWVQKAPGALEGQRCPHPSWCVTKPSGPAHRAPHHRQLRHSDLGPLGAEAPPEAAPGDPTLLRVCAHRPQAGPEPVQAVLCPLLTCLEGRPGRTQEAPPGGCD